MKDNSADLDSQRNNIIAIDRGVLLLYNNLYHTIDKNL